jgi:putative spermidine/putrescine transport system permease protein
VAGGARARFRGHVALSAPAQSSLPVALRQGTVSLMAPAVSLAVVFYIAPLARIVWVSVTDPVPGLANYTFAFASESVRHTVATTCRISLVTTLVTLIAGYLVAYTLVHAAAALRRWMIYLVLVPFYISVLVRAFAWTILLRDEGVLNNALLAIGLIGEPLALVRNELGVVIGMVHYMLPFAILTLYSGMNGVDRRLVTAAEGLGATPLQAFRMVFLPLTVPTLIGTALLILIFSAGFYITPAILGGGKVLMVAEYIAIQINETMRWGLAAALATLLMLAVLSLSVVIGRFVEIDRAVRSK